ncbi:MAG: cytochrome c oxidase subunit II transmembrane domain-containing protein, partial [Aeoliella sp.]
MFVNTYLSDSIHLPALPLAGFWFGDAASTDAQNVDDLFNLINYISFAFFALIIGMMIVFLIKYQNRKGHVELPSPSHSNVLEITWSIIPTLLLALIFFLGFKGFVEMRTPPDNAYDIGVRASKWQFMFDYPNGGESQELHVPPNQPIRLVQQ